MSGLDFVIASASVRGALPEGGGFPDQVLGIKVVEAHPKYGIC